MLIEEESENDRLRAEIEGLRAKLEDRTVRLENAGTLADASLALNGLFEDADTAAQQYVENLKHMNDSAKEECDKIILEAKEKAAKIIAAGENERLEKIREANLYVNKVIRKVTDFLAEHPDLRATIVAEKEEND